MAYKILALLTVFFIIFTGCENTSNPAVVDGLKGYIYYSTGGEVYRMQLSDQSTAKLFTNARQPDITADGTILAVETYPVTKIIYTNSTGADRQTLIEGVDYTGPIHRRYMNMPRISKDQKYVVYEGDNVYNPNSYVVDANDGELVAIIGDYDTRQPMISPTWAPDGSIFVQGWTSMNNGIYKVNPEFTAIERVDPDLSNVSAPSVSPDGSTIAFVRNGEVWTMGIDGSNPEQLYSGLGDFNLVTWSPDSKFIAAVRKGKMYIISIAKMEVTEIEKTHYIGDGSTLTWRY